MVTMLDACGAWKRTPLDGWFGLAFTFGPARTAHNFFISTLNYPVTTKPVIYVVNLSQKNFIRKGSKWLPKINEWVKSHGGGQILPVSVDFEEQLFNNKDDPEAKKGTTCWHATLVLIGLWLTAI